MYLQIGQKLFHNTLDMEIWQTENTNQENKTRDKRFQSVQTIQNIICKMEHV
jgi:hypothetical protein